MCWPVPRGSIRALYGPSNSTDLGWNGVDGYICCFDDGQQRVDGTLSATSRGVASKVLKVCCFGLFADFLRIPSVFVMARRDYGNLKPTRTKSIDFGHLKTVHFVYNNVVTNNVLNNKKKQIQIQTKQILLRLSVHQSKSVSESICSK